MKCSSIFLAPLLVAATQIFTACGSSAELSREMQAELLAKSTEWGVPQPKPDATLVKMQVYSSGGKDFHALGFREGKDAKKILIGFDYQDISNGREFKEVPNPKSVSLDDVTPTSLFSGVQGVNFGLITGIQLLRSWHPDLGLKLIEKALLDDSGHHYSAFHSPAGEPPIVMLARSCLADAMNKISSPEPDYPAIKKRIEAILKDQPQLKSESTDWAITALEANAKHKPAPPGTMESIVEAYLLGGGTEGALAFRNGDMPEAERALILKGFEAIPALLEQMKSKRFTNHIMQGFNNFPSYPMTADLVVNAYLQRLANDEFGSNWLDRQKGYTAENQAVLAWWEAASKMGEKAYIAKHAIIEKKKGEASLGTELLLIAQVRYPDLLPEIYLKALKTKTHSWPVAEALAGAEIPVERKLELYDIAIKGNREEHRNSALRFLQAERADLADEQLIRLLKKAPKTAADKYWTDQDAGLTWAVSKSNNEQVWEAVHALLDRSDLGMQMELVANLKPAKDAPPAILLSYHKIYDRFQDDERIRDNSTSEKFSGPGAGFPHEKISMRDFIHTHWAHWLGMELESPAKGATPKQWEAYRKAVSEKLRETRERKD